MFGEQNTLIEWLLKKHMDYEHKRRNVNSNCNNPEQIDMTWGGDNGNNIADAVENEGYADVASLLICLESKTH